MVFDVDMCKDVFMWSDTQSEGGEYKYLRIVIEYLAFLAGI